MQLYPLWSGLGPDSTSSSGEVGSPESDGEVGCGEAEEQGLNGRSEMCVVTMARVGHDLKEHLEVIVAGDLAGQRKPEPCEWWDGQLVQQSSTARHCTLVR